VKEDLMVKRTGRGAAAAVETSRARAAVEAEELDEPVRSRRMRDRDHGGSR
jgi:hypothetical protein